LFSMNRVLFTFFLGVLRVLIFFFVSFFEIIMITSPCRLCHLVQVWISYPTKVFWNLNFYWIFNISFKFSISIQ
jgi:hypothetical protein